MRFQGQWDKNIQFLLNYQVQEEDFLIQDNSETKDFRNTRFLNFLEWLGSPAIKKRLKFLVDQYFGPFYLVYPNHKRHGKPPPLMIWWEKFISLIKAGDEPLQIMTMKVERSTHFHFTCCSLIWFCVGEVYPPMPCLL